MMHSHRFRGSLLFTPILPTASSNVLTLFLRVRIKKLQAFVKFFRVLFQKANMSKLLGTNFRYLVYPFSDVLHDLDHSPSNRREERRERDPDTNTLTNVSNPNVTFDIDDSDSNSSDATPTASPTI